MGEVAITKKEVSERVRRELALISDTELKARITQLLVDPYAVNRVWDYGAEDVEYLCWTVLEDRALNIGIAFCNEGFGPGCPWGLVFLSGPHMNIGMDSGWYAFLEDAMRDSTMWDIPNPDDYEVR